MRLELPRYAPSLDRREFLGVAFATAAVSAMSLVPADGARAVSGETNLDHDWSIDDQWSGYPRYSESIGLGRPAPVGRPKVDAVDLPFVEY